MNTLLLDVGNSRLKWGMYDGARIRGTGQVSRQKFQDDGPGALTLRLPRRVEAVFASNVAGASFARRLSGVFRAHCGCDVRFAHVSSEACGVTNSYRQPRRLGVDRWVAMIAAYTELRKAVLVVDAGTAVTLDAVDRSGRHLGGQILPGITLMAESLASNTSDIPSVRERRAGGAGGLEMFASDTRGAVTQGALNAVIGAIERALKTLRQARHRPVVVLTGGDASRILSALGDQPLHRPHLVLEGLAVLLENH